MPPQFQVVKSQGIYHGVPTFPEKEGFKDLTAIVTGANGMCGTVDEQKHALFLTSYCLQQGYPVTTWSKS
jgi:hypothetical protein